MDKVIGLISANYSTEELGGLTSVRTVASLPFGGRYRMIDFALSSMVHSGITTIGVITPYRHRSLVDHIGAGKAWSLDRKVGGLFLLPGSVYGVRGKGTRFLLQDFAQNKFYLTRSDADYVAVSSSNVVYNLDYRPVLQYLEETQSDVVMIYQKAEWDHDDLQEIMLDRGQRVVDLEPGVHTGANAFIDSFVIRRDVLLDLIEWYAALEYQDLFEIIRQDFSRIRVRAWAYTGYAGGISSVADYLRCSQEMLSEEVRKKLFPPGRPILTKMHDSAPTRYFDSAQVRNSFINTGCFVRGTVENSILFRGVEVEQGAVIRNSIVMPQCHIGKNAVLENAILDKYYVLKNQVKICGTPENPFVGEKRIFQS